jgi:AmmeMemoRadiSam system protein A
VTPAPQPIARPVPVELDGSCRWRLLRVAREAIAAHLAGRPAPASDAALHAPEADAADAAGAPFGVFVTLRRASDGELRGCVGLMESSSPLVHAVAEMAVASASRDGRFEPVAVGELPELRIEISVLSPLTPILPEAVEVGRHGLLVEARDRRGVLLPQVPVEHGWDREHFLDSVCLKARLPADAWRGPDVRLSAFTATVFGEDA